MQLKLKKIRIMNRVNMIWLWNCIVSWIEIYAATMQVIRHLSTKRPSRERSIIYDWL